MGCLGAAQVISGCAKYGLAGAPKRADKSATLTAHHCIPSGHLATLHAIISVPSLKHIYYLRIGHRLILECTLINPLKPSIIFTLHCRKNSAIRPLYFAYSRFLSGSSLGWWWLGAGTRHQCQSRLIILTVALDALQLVGQTRKLLMWLLLLPL